MTATTTTAGACAGHPRRWTILALVLAAECMDLLDGTIVNVAAPSIHADLHAGSSALQWIVGGYALAFAIGLIAGARLGDIYGRRRLFVIGAVGFVAASVACGFATDSGTLIACRLAQGTAAAMLIPQGLGIIKEVFPPSELPRAFTWFGPVIGLSAVLGPIIGGALISADVLEAAWRPIFFVNLPLGLAAAAGAAALMPESRAPRRPDLDLVGTALAALGMGLLIYPLIQGRAAGWPAWTYAMIAASAAAFAMLVAWSRRERRRGRDALVEASIFAHRAYTAGLATIVVFFTTMAGTLLVLTLFLQLGEHFTPIHAGLTLAPFAAGSATGAVLAGAALVPRFGRRVLQAASVVMAGGLWWLHQAIAAHGLATSSPELIAPLLLTGAGIGMTISPLFDFVLAAVTPAEAGSASGVLNAAQQLGGAIGVAAIGTLFFATLRRSGYTAAIDHSLVAALVSTPLLAILLGRLPLRARDGEPESEPVPGSASVPQPVAEGGEDVDHQLPAWGDPRGPQPAAAAGRLQRV
ncbi:MAG TPA: MFS transporter [Solirubrobacteraceae bacterium]|nr:MFS transporter [Solirubrobacteraceae bacterium]